MDSDGQFDIHDLAQFLLLIAEYDAVLGCRIDRQDGPIKLRGLLKVAGLMRGKRVGKQRFDRFAQEVSRNGVPSREADYRPRRG